MPESLDDFIDESNPVCVIDVFVDALDLAEVSFEGGGTGGDSPALVPPLGSPQALHLRLSEPGSVEPTARTRSRTQCRGHVAAGSARTDHKTIADFRKDDGLALRKVCARFVELCREMGFLAKASVAIDGSKFKSVNDPYRKSASGLPALHGQATDVHSADPMPRGSLPRCETT